MIQKPSKELIQLRDEMKGSLLRFIQLMYYARTGRKFDLSFPDGRESHYITICRELMALFENPIYDLVINVPPGHGKSTIMQHFVAWCYTWFADCNFLYISYAKNLAEKHTATIKQIMQMREYYEMFNVFLAEDSTAKGNFKTDKNGSVMAFGASGSVTGQDAGLPNCPHFSGAVIIDDAHKPDEVHSDTMRQSVLDNYNETIKQRPRGENVPIIFIGQCLHEDDLAAFLKSGIDGRKRKCVVLKAIDDAGNALCPNINSLKMLRREQETNPYVFAAQYQQDPQPAGGGIFKPEWFVLHEFEPDIITTFITADTAETDKTYNDATVFSFWGLYKIKHDEIETNEYALHCIDCLELRVEPKDLKNEFLQFYASCNRYRVKPKLVAIEKKSTGTTLVSILKDYQGIQLLAIERTRESGSKIKRFLETQPYVAEKRISLPEYGKHTQMFIEHMRKITANDTHRHDDIADTLADAVKIALIDKTIIYKSAQTLGDNSAAKELYSGYNKLDKLKSSAYS